MKPHDPAAKTAPADPAASITSLEQAKARIRELDRKLDEALTIIVKRDDQLDAFQRKIFDLENRLADVERERA